MQWNPDLLHKFIAPEIARFTAADIPDLTSVHPDAQNWLANHFLNNVCEQALEFDQDLGPTGVEE